MFAEGADRGRLDPKQVLTGCRPSSAYPHSDQSTSPQLLSLLNLAISYLSPGEIYCEVGSFQGRSLVGALKDHPEILAYAIDDFSEFYRVLKPGGFALITLPDLQRVAEYVAQGKLEEPLYVSAAGPIAAIDILYGYSYDIARGNSYMAHRTGFTAKTLADKLKQAGFSTVEVIKDDLNLWATATK